MTGMPGSMNSLKIKMTGRTKLLIKQCYVKLEVHSCTNDVMYLCVYIIGCTHTKIDISRQSFVQL